MPGMGYGCTEGRMREGLTIFPFLISVIPNIPPSGREASTEAEMLLVVLYLVFCRYPCIPKTKKSKHRRARRQCHIPTTA